MSAVTHELRTPLTSIRAFTEILSDNPDLDTGRRGEFLEIILKESERLTRHINQVLDFAKIESGTLVWDMAIQPVGEVVRESVERMSELIRTRGIELGVDYGEEALPVDVDRDRLMQVVINLISNAVKFGDPEQPRVWITVQRTSDEAVVTIHDNGPGVPLEHQEVIFEKFQQVTTRDPDRPHGTGLGLPISREIIVHMGGRLWVESPAHGGAAFSFALPLHMPDDGPGGGEPG